MLSVKRERPKMDVQQNETHIIGKGVWWDFKIQKFRKKRLDLERVPMKFRCPNCGKILVPPDRRRDTYTENKKVNGDWVQITKPFPDWLVLPITYGGVCKDCYFDGFGAWGETGKNLGKGYRERKEKGRLARQRREQENIAKYGREPEYWLDRGFTKNPEYETWWQRKMEIDEDDKRGKNAKLVDSEIVRTLS